MPFRTRRVAALSAAVLLVMLTGCTDEGSDPGEHGAEEDLEQRLESLDGVDDATVETEQFDSESYWTTVQVRMGTDPSTAEVAAAVTEVEGSREGFDNYSGGVRLAESDGDAVIETEGDPSAGAAQRASWLVGAAQALPEVPITVTSDSIDVTAPEPASQSVEETAEELIGADGVDGSTIRVRSVDPDEEDNRDGGFGLGAPAEQLDRSLLRAWDDLLGTLAGTSGGPAPVKVSLARDRAGTTTVYVNLDLPSLRSRTPALGRYRAALWPTVRVLLSHVVDAAPASLAVEASSAKYVVTEPFVDFSTEAGATAADGDPHWQRLVEREARRLRR